MQEGYFLLSRLLLFSVFYLLPFGSLSLALADVPLVEENKQFSLIVKVQTDTSLLVQTESSFEEIKPIFIRIYNEHNKKIDKGLLTGLSRNSIRIEYELKDTFNIIHFININKIKTRRSAGANYLWGIVVGTSLGLSLIVGDSDFGFPSVYDGPERVAAVTRGMFAGFLGGVIYDIFKKSKIYIINGKQEKFNNFYQDMISDPT